LKHTLYFNIYAYPKIAYVYSYLRTKIKVTGVCH